MAIPELDLKKVNLQAAVGYLISLHDNEVDWNLLGIKVIGVKEALPIPDGTYEYGDAYMIGTEPPYNMYIYTRPDGKVHTEGYWFPIGKFPMPGPKGDKGNGLEQITYWTNGDVRGITYNTTDGAMVTQVTTASYKDSTDGSAKQKRFYTTTTLPIFPGKYISMNATSDNKKMEVKVDDTALALDYLKLDKTKSGVIPQNDSGVVKWLPSSTGAIANSIPQRNDQGDCNFRKLNFEFIGFKDDTSPSVMYYYDIYNNTVGSDYLIAKTPTNTGTLTTNQLRELQDVNQSKNLRIVYDNQIYYRMTPQGLPYLRYIHLDSIDDGNGGYKATGKCFSVTVSTRAWKVIDLDFGGSNRTTHNLTLTNSSTDTNIYFSLTNNRPETYEGAPAGLWSALENSPISCTVNIGGAYSSGMITTEGDNFKVFYGNSEEMTITQTEVSITDSMV